MNKQILVSALGAMLLASCADHFDQNIETVRPGKEAQYGYLEQYDALKEYIKDRPNFHLGIGTAVDEYNKKELVYALTNSNFNETVAGNAMKMSSCVADDGSMNFDKVSEYVKNATDAGLSVYGHTLAWHAQQPNKYLNRLIADKEIPSAEDNPGLIITSGDPMANTWDYEIYYDLDEPLKAGTTYRISLNVRGSEPGTIDFWPGKKDGSATQYGAGSFVVAKSAVDNSFTFTPNADIDRMRFCFGKVGGTLYFDNFILKEEGSDHNIVVNSTFDEDDITHWTKVPWVHISYEIGNVAGGFIPLLPEEKKEKLTPVLQNWIYGMMEATEGKVKAWDVVNEAISGVDKNGDGYYELQSATRGTVTPDDAKNNFYWQDYLGDIDYVRTAVAAARKGFVDAGGNPEELKLFINDYNLEAAYDQNKKLISLKHWIEEWEKDGFTKIDGIGSQMHVSYCMDPVEQKKREDAYVNMLNQMVITGKLVRISELDMGLEVKKNEVKDGEYPYVQVNTTDMTEEQHKAMRAYYEFIVKKYLEIVPENQQWGICQWCATDSPANSGWRAGLPVGLWDLDYYRKHTYGGFAAGLGAPEYWNNAK